jgi:DNA-binding PadR family transcriptional regulator
VKIYSLTRLGKERLQFEREQWQRATGIVERLFKAADEEA